MARYAKIKGIWNIHYLSFSRWILLCGRVKERLQKKAMHVVT